ncbi:MAG: isopeptide-forming domain-containing fimbrial protein [Collinsella sp.]|nr:isopeptide-forming domain-containing fimbrial protein [Collinsella sp.]
MSKNIARLAVTAGLTAALSFGGVMAPVTMAFAAEGAAATATGSVTITNVKGNDTEFYGYQIFNADVAIVNGKTVVSNITWANDDVEAAVENVIKGNGYGGTTAQDAADWITSNVTGTDETTRVDSNHIAYKIAAAVDDLTDKTTTTERVASGLKHGYWLFVTKADTINEGEAGTSPIFTVVGNAPVEITEKTGIPTVEKKIVSDADSKEHDAADSQIGQDVTYNLYGTIAENYDKYDTYFYKFSDQISKGLTLQNGAKVYLYASKDDAKGDLDRMKGTDITANFKEETSAAVAADGSKTTTWTCNNLKNVDHVTKDSYIVVSYKAKINSEATVGDNVGNTNIVKLEYSNNPMTTDTGTTVPDEVKTYTYGLKLNKVDLGTEKALPNAKFTIKVTKAADSRLQGKYVHLDGTLGDDAYKFTTGDDGAFAVKGLGAGTYTVEETDAPENYDKVVSFDFTIKPKNESGTTSESSSADKYELTAPSDQVIIGKPNDKRGDNKLEAKTNTATNDDGTFNITVGDAKRVGLPLTGLNGVTFTWIAGGAVLCIGVAHLIRSRKQAEDSEQE